MRWTILRPTIEVSLCMFGSNERRRRFCACVDLHFQRVCSHNLNSANLTSKLCPFYFSFYLPTTTTTSSFSARQEISDQEDYSTTEESSDDEEDAQRIRPLQKAQTSRRSKSSARTSKKKARRSKNPPVTEDPSGTDSDSSKSRLPSSYVENKENQRLDSNSNMANTRRHADETDEQKQIRLLTAQLQKQSQALAKEKKKKSTKGRGSSGNANEINLAAIKIIKPKKRTDMDEDEKRWIGRVWDEVNNHIWPICQFINTDKLLIKATWAVCRHMKPKEFDGLDQDELVEAQSQWVALNADHVRTGMNSVRNYAQGQLRTVAVSYFAADKAFPTIDQILDCATRAEYLDTTDEGKKIFEFYWDVLLMKVVGKRHWDKHIRHYNTIQEAKHMDERTDPRCITHSSEAFLVLLVENCRTKWVHLSDESRDGKDHDPTHKNLLVPFVTRDAGQQQWGGWSLAGRKRFKELREKIIDAQKQKHVLQLEKNCLERLRLKHEIDERDQKRKSRGKKRKMVEEEDEDDFPF